MSPFSIQKRQIGPGLPVYVIAEISANHHGSIDRAVEIIHAAKMAGADAVKLQTYTADTMTLDSDKDSFKIGKGTVWEGKNLYKLYVEAYTPWEWHPRLIEEAHKIGLDCFSSPFDETAVDFLESLHVAAYKVASFELVDLPLLKRIARTGKPVIMSTGMATLAEIQEGVETLRNNGAGPIALLKCTSAYPAPPEEMNLSTISHMSQAFGLPVGLSDHSLEVAVPVAAVVLGACIVEKHMTLSRSEPGPDSSFSLEPAEFKAMVDAIRIAQKAVGGVSYQPSPAEEACRVFRRSLFVAQPIAQGETFTLRNVRCVRPGHGLHPRFLEQVIGRKANRAIEPGTPLSWDQIG